MDNIKNDVYYLKQMIEDIEFIINETKDIEFDEFEEDDVLNFAVDFKFVQLSENTKKLSYELIIDNPDIPWGQIIGLRNKIVHEYENVILDMVFNTAKEDLPILINQLKELLNKLDKN